MFRRKSQETERRTQGNRMRAAGMSHAIAPFPALGEDTANDLRYLFRKIGKGRTWPR